MLMARTSHAAVSERHWKKLYNDYQICLGRCICIILNSVNPTIFLRKNSICMTQVGPGYVREAGLLDVALGAHYIGVDGKTQPTPELRDYMLSLPDWTVPIGWPATYDAWIVWSKQYYVEISNLFVVFNYECWWCLLVLRILLTLVFYFVSKCYISFYLRRRNFTFDCSFLWPFYRVLYLLSAIFTELY